MPNSLMKACLLVAVIWAAAYLPGLGAAEIGGMEAKRIWPALDMLELGGSHWILPSCGGEDYYNKPPGMNWPIAASFKLSGVRSPVTARMPTALAMLAFALLLLVLPSRWLDIPAKLTAAAIFLTAKGSLDFGRQAEIDGVYMLMTGIAMLWWLNVWSRKGSRWSLWIPPAIFLAYGALVKGPLLGVAFYAMAVCVLIYTRRLKELLAWQHLAAVAIMVAVGMGWVVLALRASSSGQGMLETWRSQWAVRFEPDQQHQTNWLLNFPRALLELGPWLLFMPLLWVPRFVRNLPEEHRPMFRGARLGMCIGFVAINLMPAALPRYSLPVLPLACLLLAWVLSSHREPVASDEIWRKGLFICFFALVATSIAGLVLLYDGPAGWIVLGVSVLVAGAAAWWTPRLRGGGPFSLATATAMLVAALQYYAFVQIAGEAAVGPRREAAAAINAAVPADQTLYLYRIGSEQLILYLRPGWKLAPTPDDVGPDVKYLLTQTRWLKPDVLGERVSARNPRRLVGYLPAANRFEEVVLKLDDQSMPATQP
ncbi:MAG: hypothetical protein BIFFINMI_02482 [Phycisphaerae bacterium]|nr:hypothetical protein [Phycisphaerae bacterium]